MPPETRAVDRCGVVNVLRIEVSPARMITVASGRRRQTLSMMIDAMARVGSPSQIGHCPVRGCSALAVQLMTL